MLLELVVLAGKVVATRVAAVGSAAVVVEVSETAVGDETAASVMFTGPSVRNVAFAVTTTESLPGS